MKNLQIRFVFSVITMFSVLMTVTTAFAGPVKFNQVVQIINAKPGKANTGGFSQLRLAGGEFVFDDGDGDGDDKKDGDKTKKTAPQQDDRVIIETTSEIVEDDVCDCDQPPVAGGGFPYWTLLGLGAVPLLFLIPDNDDDTPTPTPPTSPTPTMTPPTSPTPTPTMTPPTSPTPTPTMTPPTSPTPTPTPPISPTPTPMMSPTPTMSPTPPDAVPEPMTLLLFGTGLASIGLAARKKFGRKDGEEIEE